MRGEGALFNWRLNFAMEGLAPCLPALPTAFR